MFRLTSSTSGVTRGLDPRVHHLRKGMDCRVKPGNDSKWCINFIGFFASKFLFFASKFLRRDGLHQSRIFSTLAILSAPKSGTPDFGVKPGNDSRWCIDK